MCSAPEATAPSPFWNDRTSEDVVNRSSTLPPTHRGSASVFGGKSARTSAVTEPQLQDMGRDISPFERTTRLETHGHSSRVVPFPDATDGQIEPPTTRHHASRAVRHYVVPTNTYVRRWRVPHRCTHQAQSAPDHRDYASKSASEYSGSVRRCGRDGATWWRSWRCRPSLHGGRAGSRSPGRSDGAYRSTRRSARRPTCGEAP